MPPSHSDYIVACICPMGIELAPVKAMLDETHQSIPTPRDQNSYVLGAIGGHNVVIAVLPEIGNNAAAIVATQLLNDFPAIRFGLLVGIGGGVPDVDNDVDVRLGDIVVSKPTKTAGGVVQYDMGKETVHGFERTGTLNKPPAVLRAAMQQLVAQHELEDSLVSDHVSRMITKFPKMQEKYTRPNDEPDQLFEASYIHHSGKTCAGCDSLQVIARRPRSSTMPVIHYGTIGSANRVVKNATERQKLKSNNLDIICVEMEAAGVMDLFPCLVIRGICDYADSHKNKLWQPYAAAMAAAYMKELLSAIPAHDVTQIPHASRVMEIPQTHPNLYPVHWTITRPLNTLFTGREEILNTLESIVRDAIQNASSSPCWIVISGIGGQGKSEICLQLAHKVRELFWGIFWIDVNTLSLAEIGFSFVANRLNITTRTWEDTRQALAHIKKPWLLVLDNADDLAVDYQQYFPSGPLGVILLTSRNEECQQFAKAKWINLKGLSDAEARVLVIKAARIHQYRYETLEDDAQAVARLLQSHPLAIIQAGSYVSRGHCTLKEYPQVYQHHRKRLLTFRPSQARSRYGDIYAAFEASAEILRLSDSQSASDSLQLLSILASLGPLPLPILVFETAWKEAQNVSPEKDNDHDLIHLAPWHVTHLPPLISVGSSEWNSFRIVEAVSLLKSFSLVSVGRDNTASLSVSMHPLIHAWASDRLNAKEQHESWVTAGSLVALFRTGSVLWQKYQRQLQPHVHALVSRETSQFFSMQPSVMIVRILMCLGLQLYKLRDDAKLFDLMEDLLSHLGLDRMTVNSKWLELYDLRARNLKDYGRSEEAVNLMNQVVKIKALTLTEDDNSLLESQHVLALAYQANGQVQEAVVVMEHVVKLREQTLAEDDDSRLASQHVLARAYQANGQVQKAVTIMEHVVEVNKHSLVEDHPFLLASQHVLAMAYQANGQVQEAIKLLEHVVKINEQTLAEENPHRLESQNQLAIVCRANGQAQEVGHWSTTAKIREQTLVNHHQD